MRTLGKKDRPFGLRPPTKEEMEWVESWAKLYVSRVPKGVFKYKNHEEANADWDKWMAQGRFKPMNKIYDSLNSEVILSELPEGEQGLFLQHLIDHGCTIPSPGKAFRCDYDRWKQRLLTAPRDAESLLLDRCVAVAQNNGQKAEDQQEANVFKLAAMVIQPRQGPTAESKRLMQASEQYFAVHPTEELEPSEVVRKGWIVSLPRLRDMLIYRLKKGLIG
jgi:hypothetical protein